MGVGDLKGEKITFGGRRIAIFRGYVRTVSLIVGVRSPGVNLNLLFLLLLTAHAQTLKPDFVSNHAIVCLDDKCPESVGALLAVDEGGAVPSLSCSITLISADRVLTNSHCIPKNLRFSGAACGPQIELSFPKIGDAFPEEDIACDHVEAIGTTDIEGGGSSVRDWAILKLKKSPARNFAEVSQQSLEFGKIISAYPVFYSPFVPMGQLYKVDCTVSELGYSDPQTFHPSSALFFAKDCAFYSHVGNSGTGIFNNDGQYVGLINSIVHKKNQSAVQAASEGSPLIIGLKALCLPFFGKTSLLCDLPEDDESFHRATVIYSSLVAFEKSLKKNGIDPLSPPPTSSVIQWERATPQNVAKYFSLLYDYIALPDALEYFNKKGLPEISQEFGEKAASVIGYVPRCVNAGAVDSQMKMNYAIFNFRDATNYPGEQGLYVNIDTTRELLVESVFRQLPLTATLNADGQFTIKYSAGAGEYALTPEEQEMISSVCKKEEADKKEGEALVPSLACQTVYKKWSNSVYLENFSVVVPSCL